MTSKERKKLKDEISKRIAQPGFSIRSFAQEKQIDRDTIRRIIRGDAELEEKFKQNKYVNAKTQNKDASTKKVEKEFSENTGVVTTRSLDIKTLEDAIRIAEVDLSIWDVERHVINSWEVTIGGKNSGTDRAETYTNFQVKMWLRRKSPVILELENLYEKIQSQSPIVPKRKQENAIGVVSRELEISLTDVHLGMRTFKGAADQDWTPKQAAQMAIDILENLISLSLPHGPFEQIVFPMGNDFLHSDNVYNTTTRGTPQPEADAWKQNLLAGELLLIQIVNRLKTIAPVKIISVPGNHAMHTEISLSRVLNAYYHNDDNVTIDCGFSNYKFHKFGVNLIGFEHGHSIRKIDKLAGLMANETRLNGWADARWCEWHLGDQHRKGSGRPSVMSEQGVNVEFLPSLVPSNEWHRNHGFNGGTGRAAMAFVWDKTAGPISRVQVNIDHYSNLIMV